MLRFFSNLPSISFRLPNRDPRTLAWLLCLPIFLVLLGISPLSASAQANPCPRYAPGSTLAEPENLFSSGGKLQVNLTYQASTDPVTGNQLFCFVADDGSLSPTLHVFPGDELIINLKNALPAGFGAGNAPMDLTSTGTCAASNMDTTSVNMHFHGTNLAPVCTSDEVIHTLVNSGQSYQYDMHFPSDEPPGLYWYHPHVHGLAEWAVLGGATGAIIVEGIADFNPLVAGMPTRTLILRDSLVAGYPQPGGPIPSWDLSLNYIPVAYPNFTPAVIPVKPLETQFWRILNSSADTITDLQLIYDGVPQPFLLVSLDGVPLGSQDGTFRGVAIPQTDVLLAPAARAEIVVLAPSLRVKKAQLVTRSIDTGPDGDNDPARPLATIQASASAPEPPLRVAPPTGANRPRRFAGLSTATPTATRTLYFSELLSDPSNPLSPTNFFVTVDGQTPVLFDPNNPPSIVTTQGAVEDWTIENRSLENHVFHIHQIHFKVLEKNGAPVLGPYLDTLNIPYWNGSDPYPSVKVRMDFRGPVVGDFVYHCHILGHEDNGMMAIIRVNPK